ncbi:hypothetical protein HS1genome_0832 [Sulfodiicoccus acidiphilus]|uniref:DUF1286 domain-containing protein n=1 Tax=Sulfodiicoccus acidiphilus TaxID=1670455 RepID=A0A348B2P1_9CREN|nr:hypothetical protein HS1genome_0832 [Sulfodiicoccus acidiphilus]GGT97105.1 hypothetical protein GCM10007116_13260 [Sulfodiicoccus acidiphilus]
MRRTPRTHTLPRSVLWGLLPSLPFLFLFRDPLPLALGLLVGPSHMFLDVFKERGIYVKKGGRRRIALAHFSYDDPLVNGLAVLLGALMLFASMRLHTYHYYNYYS